MNKKQGCYLAIAHPVPMLSQTDSVKGTETETKGRFESSVYRPVLPTLGYSNFTKQAQMS